MHRHLPLFQVQACYARIVAVAVPVQEHLAVAIERALNGRRHVAERAGSDGAGSRYRCQTHFYVSCGCIEGLSGPAAAIAAPAPHTSVETARWPPPGASGCPRPRRAGAVPPREGWPEPAGRRSTRSRSLLCPAWRRRSFWLPHVSGLPAAYVIDTLYLTNLSLIGPGQVLECRVSTVRPALQKGEIEMGKINTSLAGKVAISPSVTRTEIIEEWIEEFEAAMDDESFRFNPMRRICEPEEIAAAIVFVSSPAGGFHQWNEPCYRRRNVGLGAYRPVGASLGPVLVRPDDPADFTAIPMAGRGRRWPSRCHWS